MDNESIICCGETTENGDNAIVTAMNLDPYHVRSSRVELDRGALGIDPHAPYQVHELLTGARYLWSGARNYVSLDPQRAPAHVERRRLRSECDFDYFP
jgi:starch synthase (maltosyl-transferring)